MCVKNVFRGVLNYLTHCTVREVIGVPPTHPPAASAPRRVSEASQRGALLETTRTARPSEAARRGKSQQQPTRRGKILESQHTALQNARTRSRCGVPGAAGRWTVRGVCFRLLNANDQGTELPPSPHFCLFPEPELLENLPNCLELPTNCHLNCQTFRARSAGPGCP